MCLIYFYFFKLCCLVYRSSRDPSYTNRVKVRHFVKSTAVESSIGDASRQSAGPERLLEQKLLARLNLNLKKKKRTRISFVCSFKLLL